MVANGLSDTNRRLAISLLCKPSATALCYGLLNTSRHAAYVTNTRVNTKARLARTRGKSPEIRQLRASCRHGVACALRIDRGQRCRDPGAERLRVAIPLAPVWPS